MKYLLKNKDKVVLEFETEEEIDTYRDTTIKYVLLKNASIVDESLLPKQIFKNHLLSSLESWIKRRKVPSNREFVEEILDSLPANSEHNLTAYIDISFALSLNDSYWIVPSDKDYRWKDYNLYDNEFDKALELVAFMGASNKVSGITSSPEYTTNGMLKKCWHRENGQIYLYKGSTKNENGGYGKEAYSEYYMAQVAEVMGFDYVPYDLKLFHNELVSTCPIFTNENEGYVPIYDLLQELLRKPVKDYTKLVLMKIIPEAYGKESFENLMLFDALICNKDRHLGNFGMIVDNNTGKILRPAPIFDNGLSIFSLIEYPNDEWLNKKALKKKSWFDVSFKKQLNYFAEERHTPNLEKLSEFSFKRHKEFNLSEEWLQPIEKHIRDRAIMALRFIEENRQNSSQESTDDSDDDDDVHRM